MGQITRRQVLLGAGAILATRTTAAQRPTMRKIGFLDAGTPTTRRAEWVQKEIPKTLEKYGFVQGRNLAVEFRFAEGRQDKLISLANDLIRHQVDVIVTIDNQCALAAKQLTRTIPIVMAASSLPVEVGLITSYARPGGNITGFDWTPTPDLLQKRYHFLKLAVPQAKRAINLRHSGTPTEHLFGAEFLQKVATSTGLVVERVEFARPEELPAALERVAAAAPDVLSVTLDATHLRTVAAFASNKKLVSIGGPGYVNADGLMGHVVHSPTITDRIASHISKVLLGAKPSELPVELATRYELLLNMKVANVIGVKLPPSFMTHVDRVIE